MLLVNADDMSVKQPLTPALPVRLCSVIYYSDMTFVVNESSHVETEFA